MDMHTTSLHNATPQQNTNRRLRFQHAFINGDLDPGLQFSAVFFVASNNAAGVQCR